ncbi:hypothetical protein FOQG_16770 [Fusarium oxysporum f. sp. raphani 54005]|uniref:FluG domain-containing protein n=1 Tax=Fusarium oxysporum f. sp. raphani 54005 TaxID=1089458 RepID=X0BI67_FUSOX|nr:hypothetical protein FOQG_16770 [Fusarium oxysporum f. sp. raphani 54005]
MPQPVGAKAVAPSRVSGSALHRNQAAFLDRFRAREEQKRIAAKQKQTLSLEQHAAHRTQLSNVLFIKPKYSDETQVNVSGVLRKWIRYCSEMKVGEWKATIKNLKRETAQDFILFMCENYLNITSWSTVEVYIRQLQQLHTTITGRYMDRNDSKELYKYYRAVCIPRFGHRPPNIDGKPVLNGNSLREITHFNWAYDTSIFPGERHRIQLAGCYQILCYTGARPAELVDGQRKKPKDGSIEMLFGNKAVQSSSTDEDQDEPDSSDLDSKVLDDLLCQETVGRGRPKALCYEDIQMMIIRHPETRRCIPAMAIKFVHHKGADNKPRPTIFHFTPDDELLLCPILTILALALHDQAFDAPSLTNARRIFSTKPSRHMQSIPLRWKQSMLKTPVFRRYHGPELSKDDPMPYSKLNHDMGQQSLDSGNEKKWTPRFARRGAANAVNGNAPDSVRDQMMRHDPRFMTFQNAYLNEIANFDIQNAFLEKPQQKQCFQMLAHVSLTRDPRATADMVPKEVWASLPPDPEIVALEEERSRLKQGSYRIEGHPNEERIRELTDSIRAKTAQRAKRFAREYREDYFYNCPTWDIERQARGEDEEDEFVVPAIELAIPERAALAKLLCYQRDDLTPDELDQLRIEVIDLKVVLCDKRETVKRDRIRDRVPDQVEAGQPESDCVIKSESPGPDPSLAPALDHFPLLMQATQCPDCFGDERLPLQERTFSYCRPTVMNDHFDSHHLHRRETAEQHGESMRCDHPRCKDTKFRHVDHFRSHVQRVHGVILRTSEQVKQKRQRKARRRQMVGNKA